MVNQESDFNLISYITELKNKLNNLYGFSLVNDNFVNELISSCLEMNTNTLDIYNFINDKFANLLQNSKLNVSSFFNYNDVKIAYDIFKNKLNDYNNIDYYIIGKFGLNLLIDEDVNEKYDKVNIVCNINDINKIRNVFYNSSYYNKDYKDDIDYGLTLIINNIPFIINTYNYILNKLIINSYNEELNKYERKYLIINDLNNYLKKYTSTSNKIYNIESLESIYKKLVNENNHKFDKYLNDIKIDLNKEFINFNFEDYNSLFDLDNNIDANNKLNDKTVSDINTRGYINSVILSLITGFLSGLALALTYYWIVK